MTTEIRENGIVVDFRFKVTPENDANFLLTSDWHWDNPQCDRDLLELHLKQCKQKDAYALVFGDMFCAMEGRGDPRRSKDIRPEHNNAKYLDSIVDTFIEWVQPYKDIIRFISYGNHETGIIRNCETDLIDRVCKLTGIISGKYSGFIRFMPWVSATMATNKSTTLYYHHGTHGGEVTKGVIGANRRSTYVQNADIIVSGHNHEGWILETPVDTITQYGKHLIKSVWHVNTPTYKQDYQHDGYHVIKGRPPKPLGGWWLKFKHTRKNDKRYTYEFTRTSYI